MPARRFRRVYSLIAFAALSVAAASQGNAAMPDPPAPAFEVIGAVPYCSAMLIHGDNPRGASASAAGGKQVIVFDPVVMRSLPYSRAFTLAHECAHHLLRHTSIAGLLREGHDFQAKELAADCMAAELLIANGEKAEALAQRDRFQSLGDTKPGPRYPSFERRAAELTRCMGAEK